MRLPWNPAPCTCPAPCTRHPHAITSRRDHRRRLRRAVCRQGPPSHAGDGHAGRPSQPPRLSAPAVSGRHGRAVAGRYRGADSVGAAPSRQRAGAAGRGAGDRPRRQARRPRPRRRAVVRLPDRGRRCRQLLLRPRRLGAACAVTEDARRRVEREGADAVGVRAGRALDRSGRAAAPADLRRWSAAARPVSRWRAPLPRSRARRSSQEFRSISTRRSPRAAGGGRSQHPRAVSRVTSRRRACGRWLALASTCARRRR